MEYFACTVFKQPVNTGLRKARLMILIFAWIERTGIQVYDVKQQSGNIVLAV